MCDNEYMSKTYKTRPLSVRVADVKDNGVGIKEVHDHRNGECDLPSSPVEQLKIEGTTKCHWSYAYNGRGLCGCGLCTERFQRRMDRRRERHNSKRSLRNAE